MQLKKIVILGPESTGKSTLCALLAAHYKSSWVPEYARTYLQDTGNAYAYEDLWEIAKGQRQSTLSFVYRYRFVCAKNMERNFF